MANAADSRTNLPLLEEIQALTGVFRRHRRPMVAVGTFVAVVGAIWVFTRPTTFRAEITVLPTSMIRGEDASAWSGAMGSLGRRFGLELGGADANPSATFPTILASRAFYNEIVRQPYPCKDGRVTDLDSLLAGSRHELLQRREVAYQVFKKDVLRVVYNGETGVTSIGVILRDPVTAAAVANSCAKQLDTYTLSLRQTKSREWGAFLERRVQEIAASLGECEERLRQFREANRSLTSPALQLEEARLDREVRVQQELYMTVIVQYENAQLESLKDTSIITVVDQAFPPLAKFRPQRAFMLLILVIVAVVCAVATAIGLSIWRAYRTRLV